MTNSPTMATARMGIIMPREDKALLEQIKNDMIKHQLLRKGDGVVVGLSGGADSVCLLKVLLEFKEDFSLTLTAVHVNHGLRGHESDEDQAFVERLCKDWNVSLKTFRVDLKQMSHDQGSSLEEAGREIRYKLFHQVMEETGAGAIAVAHHREDQAETIMLHILRGTGLDGLCGMNIKQGPVIRPLLNVGRAQILEYLEANGIPFRIDSSNLTDEFTRNRIRNVLFPMIQEMFSVDPSNQLLRLSHIIREDQDFIETVAQEAYLRVLLSEDGKVELSLKELQNFPTAIIKRIIRRAWERINTNRKNLERVHVDQIAALCQDGRTGKRAPLPKGFEARISYDKLIFEKQAIQAQKPYAYPISYEGITEAEQAGGVLHAELISGEEAFGRYGNPDTLRENAFIQLFDYDKLECGITLRNRKDGDRIRPYGSGGEKKLKDYFIDQKVPWDERSRIPLVAKDQRIVWIIGMRTSEDYRARWDTKEVLVLSWEGL